MARQVGVSDVGHPPAPVPGADPPIVVQYRNAVTAQPHIALKSGRTEPHGESEGVGGVLGSVGPTTAVGEQQRGIFEGPVAGGHGAIMPDRSRPSVPGRAGRVDHVDPVWYLPISTLGVAVVVLVWSLTAVADAVGRTADSLNRLNRLLVAGRDLTRSVARLRLRSSRFGHR